MTFREERFEGGWVDVVGARAGCIFVFARVRCCGTLREEEEELALVGARGVEVGALPLVNPEGARKPPRGGVGRGGGARDEVAGFNRGGLRLRSGGRDGGGIGAALRSCSVVDMLDGLVGRASGVAIAGFSSFLSVSRSSSVSFSMAMLGVCA